MFIDILDLYLFGDATSHITPLNMKINAKYATDVPFLLTHHSTISTILLFQSDDLKALDRL